MRVGNTKTRRWRRSLVRAWPPNLSGGARQKKRLGRRYQSYWYAVDKGRWSEQRGWPTSPEDWKTMRAWIVRRKLTPAAATRAAFGGDLAKTFRDLYPLLRFACLSE